MVAVRISRIAGAIAATMLLTSQAPADEELAAYLAGTCNTCHRAGDKGTAIPALAGREAADLMAALQAYRTGARRDAIMHAVATSLTDAELSAVATYLAHQEPGP
jgi:cytochrome subunit of sulfide dehydrogenase